jgi:predicted amidohydrolase YtcJ
MNMVKLILNAHRAFRLHLVQGLIATAVMVAAAVAPVAADKMDDSPDLVLYNGKISTVDANNSTVEAIAIRDGTIIARGGSRQVQALATKSTRLINLNGRRVLPGLIDGHLHGMRNAYHCFTQTVRLDLVTSRTEALAAYAAKAASLSAGRWIWTTSGGWNLNQLDTPRGLHLQRAQRRGAEQSDLDSG